MGKIVFKDIKKLNTPVGYFHIVSDNDEVSFMVERNLYSIPYNIYDENNSKVIGSIPAVDTNYLIKIDTTKFEIGKNYNILFSAGEWDFCDSDEHTECYDAIIDGWSVGIGAYDPNDDEKIDQAYRYSDEKGLLKQKYISRPDTYDESKFIEYTTEVVDEHNGFTFRIYDYSMEYIYFSVAWIKIDEYATLDYEGALGFWLC